MHNLWLTFIDKETEQKYQINAQQYRRWSTFKLVTFGFIIVFIVKAAQALISKNIHLFAQSLSISIYLILQLILTKKSPKYLRLALIFTNHILTIYFIAYEDRIENPQIAMLQGVNQMAATYLLILIGEFVDGAITFFNLSIFRIIWAIKFGSSIQFSAITSSLLLILYINYFNYQFHRARRSQFLLTLVDSHWEEILQQLVKDKHYILLQFCEDSLEFTFKSSNLCSSLFTDVKGIQNFLCQSICQRLPLKTFIYKKIKQFTQDQSQTFRDCQTISFQKKILNSEISIFLGNQPTILLVIRDFKSSISFDSNSVIKQQSLLIKLILNTTKKLLHKIEKDHKKFQNIICFQRKIIIYHLISEVRMNLTKKSLDLFYILKKIAKYYQEKQIKWKIINVGLQVRIETEPSLLSLLFFLIFEEQKGNHMIIIIEKLSSSEEFKIIVECSIKKQKIVKVINQLKLQFQLILNNIILEDHLLLFHLKQEIDLPYQFEELKLS